MVAGLRGKDRPAYEKVNVNEIPFDEQRATFPIELLRTVVQVRQERTIRPVDQSVKLKAHAYPLSGIVYCAHCDRRAIEQGNPKLRSLLSGNTSAKGVLRYRHKLGLQCGVTNRSMPCEVADFDFSRLLQLLTIRPETQAIMLQLAIAMDGAHGPSYDAEALERKKQEAITLCRRRIDAAVVLYGDGMIDKDEYRRRVEQNEREIVHWQARTTETHKIAVELAMCVEAMSRLARLWDSGSDEDKQALARSLFTEVIIDLDTHRIVGFKLKPWADRFLTLRATLYDQEENDAMLLVSQSEDVQQNDLALNLLGGTSYKYHKLARG